MKILIVDDEQYTREGIAENVNWLGLGIELCVQCENGQRAYEKAMEIKPEIILTDVRMPVMDGIELAKKIRRDLPMCKVIFMSGFSDKEYLLAAMRLKVVDYVEKPISIPEIEAAVKKAAEELKSESEMQKSSRVLSSLEYLLRSEIALLLTKPDYNAEVIGEKLSVAKMEEAAEAETVSAIFKVYGQNVKTESFSAMLMSSFGDSCAEVIAAQKDSETFVAYFIGSGNKRLDTAKIAAAVSSAILQMGDKVLAAMGEAESFPNAYRSYSSAVVNIERSFYFGYGKLVLPTQSLSAYEFSTELISEFENALFEQSCERAMQVMKTLSTRLKIHTGTLVSSTKNFMCKIYIALEKAISELSEAPCEAASEDIFSAIISSHTLEEIIETITKRMNMFFEHLNTEEQSNSVWKIKSYIRKNYMNPDLSVYDIAEYVGLNTSYVNVLFRKKTGMSINGYITEYRIKVAEKLLMQHNPSIQDIAIQSGYQNANYFSKVFKKVKGMVPKEYRRRYMR